MDLVRSIRAERTVQKRTVEHRIHLCEKHLEALRKELLDADKDIEDVENCVLAVRDFLLRAVPDVEVSSGGLESEEGRIPPSMVLYHSDGSDSDSSSISSLSNNAAFNI